MADLMEHYVSKYGPVESGYLYTLGGDPVAIVAEVERQQAAPEADGLAFLAPLVPSTTPEEDAHNAILREIQRLYFLPISRASALAVCNVLGEAGELIPFPGLPDFRFNSWAFKDGWNEAHPDETKIKTNGTALLSV